jgi:hypothetical protein
MIADGGFGGDRLQNLGYNDVTYHGMGCFLNNSLFCH